MTTNKIIKLFKQFVGKDLTQKAVSELLANNAQYNRLYELVKKEISSKNLEVTSGIIQFAANHSWMKHPGFFSSLGLENFIREIAQSITLPVTRNKPNFKNSVCHVLTRARLIGGHTKLVYRWIIEQTHIKHNLLITRQMGAKIPPSLINAVKASGGKVIDLQREAKTWLQKISYLISCIENSSAVILHIHPYDVVCLLAIAKTSDKPSVAFMNHSDHVFWLGTDFADKFIHFREVGIQLSENRRGISKDICEVLPLLINQTKYTKSDRKNARNNLGISESRIIAVTIASNHKFSRMGSIDFSLHHAKLAALNKNFTHFVIGPISDNNWIKAFDISENRLVRISPTYQISTYLAAADFYIDSYPLGSSTSYLEAGASGLPIISFNPWEGKSGIIHSPEKILELGRSHFINQEEYDAAFMKMITSPEDREINRNILMSRISARHSPDSWGKILKRIWLDLLRENQHSIVKKTEQNNEIEIADLILTLTNQVPVNSTKGNDLAVIGMPVSGKLSLMTIQKLGLVSWIPENVFCKFFPFIEKD